MKTLADQIAEATEWAIVQWDSVIDAALKDYGLGAKPSPQQRGAMTRRIAAGVDALVDNFASEAEGG